MNKILISVILLIINYLGYSQHNPIEQALRGVVTVTVEKAQPIGKTIYGYRGPIASEAYDKSLSISNAVGSGSGFIIKDGSQMYIITNAHVIESASDEPGSIYVYAFNRNKYEVFLLGADSFYDVAVLAFKDSPGTEIGALEFVNREPLLGERVFAIGNPLGEYPNSVSDGIVSALNRTRSMNLWGKFGYLQTTASLIWGNSGGPLLDEQGKVLGINSQIAFAQGPDGNTYLQQQINFALEPDLSKKIIHEIINHGKLVRSYFGIELIQRYEVIETYNGYAFGPLLDERPIIGKPIKGSPGAAKLDQWQGAILTHLNDKEVFSIEDALQILENVKPGDSLKLRLVHNETKGIVTIIGNELDASNLEAIARHVLRMNESINIDESSPQLRVKNTFEEDSSISSYYSDEYKYIIAAGNLDYNEDVWRITTLADLGGVLRMYGTLGAIQYGLLGDQDDISDAEIIYQSFSNYMYEYQVMLWY